MTKCSSDFCDDNVINIVQKLCKAAPIDTPLSLFRRYPILPSDATFVFEDFDVIFDQKFKILNAFECFAVRECEIFLQLAP